MPVIGRAFEVPHGIATVDGATFDASVLAAPGPVAVEFMSYGCAHCRVLEPIIEHVATLLADREMIVRVNVAVEHELADRYAIEVTPTVLMFLDGREVGRVKGPRPTVKELTVALSEPFDVAGTHR